MVPVHFPTRNTEHNTSGPGQRGFDDTSRGKVSWSGGRMMTGSENVGGEDQGSENAENGYRRWEEHSQQE